MPIFGKAAGEFSNYENEKWNEVFIGKQRTVPICLCGEYPDGNCPLWEAPQEKFDEIKSSETVTWSWDQKILKGTDKNCLIWIDASPGKYKVEFRYFDRLDPDKREWRKIYSNEFTIGDTSKNGPSLSECRDARVGCEAQVTKEEGSVKVEDVYKGFYEGVSCEEWDRRCGWYVPGE